MKKTVNSSGATPDGSREFLPPARPNSVPFRWETALCDAPRDGGLLHQLEVVLVLEREDLMGKAVSLVQAPMRALAPGRAWIARP